MKVGPDILHIIHITALVLILNSFCKYLRNLEKCGQNLGFLQCKILTSDLNESETCHISQMNAFFMFIAWLAGLLAALGGTIVILIQSCKICLQKLQFLT